jgi:hypothetical protein
MPRGCFQGCAPEGAAIKWRLFVLSVYAEDGSLSKLVAPTPHYNASLHPAAVFPFAVQY